MSNTVAGARLHEREKQWMRDNAEQIAPFHRKTLVRKIKRFGQVVELRHIADAIPFLHSSPNRKPRR